MKKFFVILAAAALMFGMVGQASAALVTGDLIRVIWAVGGTNEQMFDVGAQSGLAAMNSQTIAGSGLATSGASAYNITALGGASSLATSYVAYFINGSTVNDFYVAATGMPVEFSESTSVSAFKTMWTALTNNYNLTAGSGATYAMADVGSYDGAANNLYSSGQSGTYGGLGFALNVEAGAKADTSLANLATAAVDMKLYRVQRLGQSNTVVTLVDGITIRTLLDANNNIVTMINPTAVPVPPSVLLLGSGLLGMFGIRRKMA